MASTVIIYGGDGTTVDFTVPFDYLKKTFVRVILDNANLTGGDYGDTSVDYYFLDDTTVRLKTAPASGSELTIRRYTSATDRVVTFKDASILKATDLDTSQLQAFHIAEEARDIINDALVKDRDGNWDAKGNRIVNVGDPVDENDAMTYGFYLTDKENVKDLVEQAEAYRDQALQYRNEAETIKGDTQTIKDETAQIKAETQQIKTDTEGIRDATQTIKEETQQIKEDALEETSDLVALAKDWATKMDAKVNGEDYSSKYWANEAKKIQPNLDIVADNIDDVVNVSNNMDDVNIIAGDLDGQISASIGTDMGRVGTGSSGGVEITGGNIKTVADNIEDVQRVGDLIESGQVDIIINAVATTNENVTKAKQSEDNAKVSETNAKTSETNAKASENLARDWAIKTDGLVNNEDYSSKYWAGEAKKYADSTSSNVEEITTAKNEAISAVKAEGTTQVGLVTTEGTKIIGTATSAINDAKDKAVTTVQTEGSTQTKAVTDAGTAQVSAVNTAGTTQVSAVKTEGTTQTGLVTDEGTKQVGLVTEAGTTQVAAVGSAGTTATEAVDTAKDNAVTAVSAEGTNQVTLVQKAGSTAMTTINASVGLAKDWSSKMDGPVEGEEYSAKYWANQASFGQVQADWAQTNAEEVDFIKNKPTLGALASKDSIDYSEITGTPPSVDLTPYMKTVDADAKYATKASLSIYATKTELGGYATTEALTTGLAGKLDTSTANSTYATKTELSSGLAAKLDTATANSTFATKTELASKANSNHTHTAADITDFTAQVNTLINNSRITDYGRVGN